MTLTHKQSARLAGLFNLKLLALTTLLAVPSGALRADTLTTTGYNFQLNGGGGGATAVLNGTTNLEIFCVDFNNDIYVPHSNYSANLSALTSSGFNASTTRFGNVTSWATVTIAGDTTDSSTINNAGALQRYQMAAYLVSLYNLAGGNNASNNGIQMAIWTILDPTAYAASLPSPATGNPTTALEEAAQWLSGTSSSDRDAFLAGWDIISDATMIPGSPQSGGFQEQITRVPEPGFFGMLAFCLLGFVWQARRRRLAHATNR